MKNILISIQPQWVERILNGEKTVEIRKTVPNCELPCRVYIYCTKAKLPQQGKGCVKADHLTMPNFFNGRYSRYVLGANYGECLNGKVVAEFTLNKVEDFSKWEYDFGALVRHIDLWAGTRGDYPFLINYLKGQKKGYAWHIEDLAIYDKPKELSEFKKYCNLVHNKQNIQCFKPLCKNKEICNKEQMAITRPPQSWCYVEGLYEN